MNGSNFIEAIQVFLMDIFAFLIPGATTFIMVYISICSANNTFTYGIFNIPPANSMQWIVLFILSYILGYITQGFGEGVVIRVFEIITRRKYMKWLLFGEKDSVTLKEYIEKSQWFKEVKDRLSFFTNTDLSTLDYRELRNIALSLSPNWSRQVYRYTYTGQLCLGVASGLLINSLLIILTIWVPILGASISTSRLFWLIPLLIAVLLLINRRNRYYGIQMRIPFSIALAEIPQLETKINDNKEKRK
jgi:hypothetical protein